MPIWIDPETKEIRRGQTQEEPSPVPKTMPPAPAPMLDQLKNLLLMKRVSITHTNKRLKSIEGICVNIHAVPGETKQFNIELSCGRRVGFVAEIITADSVDGELLGWAGDRRKIQVI